MATRLKLLRAKLLQILALVFKVEETIQRPAQATAEVRGLKTGALKSCTGESYLSKAMMMMICGGDGGGEDETMMR